MYAKTLEERLNPQPVCDSIVMERGKEVKFSEKVWDRNCEEIIKRYNLTTNRTAIQCFAYIVKLKVKKEDGTIDDGYTIIQNLASRSEKLTERYKETRNLDAYLKYKSWFPEPQTLEKCVKIAEKEEKNKWL